MNTLARINLRLTCGRLFYYSEHSVCGKTVSAFPLSNCSLQRHSALICQAGFLGEPLLPATTKVSSHKAQHRQQDHSPALLHTIKGQRQDRHRNENRQASVRANKVSNVGRNVGAWQSRNLQGKMPIMAYFPAVKNIKTHFKNVVLTTAISGP